MDRFREAYRWLLRGVDGALHLRRLRDLASVFSSWTRRLQRRGMLRYMADFADTVKRRRLEFLAWVHGGAVAQEKHARELSGFFVSGVRCRG